MVYVLHIPLQPIPKHLLKLLQLRFNHKIAIRLIGIICVIILMIILRGIEVFVGLYGGDDGPGKGAAFVELVFIVSGLFFLGLVVIEDDAAVLGALVVTLAVEGSGVVGFPENFEEFVVGDLSRIVDDLAGFGVAGGALADLFVGGIGHIAAAITGGDFQDAVHLVEDGFGTPETTGAEGRRIGGGEACVGRGKVHSSIRVFLLGTGRQQSYGYDTPQPRQHCVPHTYTFVKAVLY